MKTLDRMIPGESKKAKAALMALPAKVRDFYEAYYGAGVGNKAGEFIGLVCRVCNYWQDCGHERGCPVKKLEGKHVA